jgi:hypothetical protein
MSNFSFLFAGGLCLIFDVFVAVNIEIEVRVFSCWCLRECTMSSGRSGFRKRRTKFRVFWDCPFG